MVLTETCYMCDSPRTSREHVPPECLFPSKKEIGSNLRRNLITVPSCDEHNSRKSEDDEFMRAIILFIAVEDNQIAQNLFLGKMLRAVKRSPQKYTSYIEEKGSASNNRLRILKVDWNRFKHCIDHMVRALYFHNYKSKWEYPIHHRSPNFFNVVENDAPVPDKVTMELVKLTRIFLEQEPTQGENPEVFKYRLRYDEKNSAYAFEGVFYNFFEIYSYSSSKLSCV